MVFVSNNVPGNGSAITSSGFVVTATATASASSNVSQTDAYNQALALANSIAQSSAQNQANIMDQTIVINDSPAVTPDTITLYYKLAQTGTKNSTNVQFLNNSDTYTGITNRFMTNASGSYNQDIITFIGYRTPGDDSLGIPNLFCETVMIKTPQGDFISGLANYIDNGSGRVTSSSYENFAVTCASGNFAGYKNIKITYLTDLSRIVTITN